MRRQTTIWSTGAVLAAVLASGGLAQQRAAQARDGDWPMYRHDYSGSGHSPLTQINTRNVTTLERVWTYGLQNEAAPAAPAGRGGGGGINSEATPIVAGGVMYLPAAGRIVALQPETGKELWRYTVAGSVPS